MALKLNFYEDRFLKLCTYSTNNSLDAGLCNNDRSCSVVYLKLEESDADFRLVIEIAQIVTTTIAVDIVKSIVLLNSGTVGLGAAVLV